jgi:hypothetical protein
MSEIDEMDEVWRTISKKFQALLPELHGEEVDRLMKTIKKEKGIVFKILLSEFKLARHFLLFF